VSLRLRLVLAVAAVVLASIVAVAISSSRMVRIELERLVRDAPPGPPPDPRAVAARIAAHHRGEGWEDVGSLLLVLRYDHFDGHDLLLVDARDRLIAATAPVRLERVSWREETVRLDYETHGRLVTVTNRAAIRVTGGDGALLATLIPVPRQSRRSDGALQKVNRGLLAIVIAVGLVAMLSTVLLARGIVRPVEQLQHAVGRIESGDVGHRVEVSSRDELGGLARAFNAMSGELARDRVLRRNLVDDVAHELRTPLTNLICTVEAIQDGLRAADGPVLASLHDDLMLLQRLVEDLQTLSLAEAGTLPLHREPVPVRDAVERLVASLPEAARARISVDVPKELRLDVDRMRFHQIVGNLIVNALAHGGAAGRIEVFARAFAGRVELAVRDSGAGIAPEHLPHVFDRFYRADPSRARSTGGAGLGLAIVKNLVELHGARIDVQSAVGEGSTFRIAFPA
jgi:signal transduction histidine kinase